jgi:NDP-sugar pyrophosphorylase family protein
MIDILAGMVLAAGMGTRLHPLTYVRAKALCPVANVALVDRALAAVTAVTGTSPTSVAVNAHHHAEQVIAHLDGAVHLSHEVDRPLGTAGAIGFARPWIDGRPVLVTNADAWHEADLGAFVEGWDGERVRLLLAGADRLDPGSRIVASILPAATAAALPAEPAGLYEVCWRDAAAAGRLDVARYDGPFVDCGSPADYLRANLLASGGESVVHPRAQVRGTVERSVVWDTGVVDEGEHLVDAIRIGYRLTVLVR